MKLSEALVRQRRNLIFISSTLVMLKLGQVQISKLSVASIEFTLGRPNAMYWGLWAMFVYFTIRYVQYCIEDSGDEVKRLYLKEMDRITKEQIVDILTKEQIEKDKQIRASSPVQTFGLAVLNIEPKIQANPYSTYVEKDGYLFGAAVLISNGSNQSGDIPVRIHTSKFKEAKLVAIINLCLFHTLFTELGFPIVFAIGTAIYAGSGGWPGGELF